MVLFGFASYQGGRFELIVKDDETGEETTLHGQLRPGQLEIADRILPTCVFVPAASENHTNALELDRLSLVIESAVRNADPARRDDVVALLKANRASIAKTATALTTENSK